MRKKVVIIGAGPAGLAAAYNLVNASNYEVIIIDEGQPLGMRKCAVREGKTCTNCRVCNITHGFGGSGTFSDCKLSLCPYEVGGDVSEYITDKEELDFLAERAKEFFVKFDNKSDTRTIIGQSIDGTLQNKLAKEDLRITYNPTMHVGTDGTYSVMENLYKYLVDKGVTFYFNRVFDSIYYQKEYNNSVIITNHGIHLADYVIFAPGRSGNKEITEILKKDLNINTIKNSFDIGFRVELPAKILKELTDAFYDMKISYIEPITKLKVRTFCTNPNGFVSEEHYDDGTVLANGHSYADKKSNMTNFAVLVTFPPSYNQKAIFDSFNIGRITCMNVVDIINIFDNNIGNVSYYLKDNTLKNVVVPSYPFSKEYYTSIVTSVVLSFLRRLDKIYPGVIDYNTYLYGIEAKFYNNRVEVNNHMETKVPGVYVIGDGSGITRGIIQSVITGLIASDDIINH